MSDNGLAITFPPDCGHEAQVELTAALWKLASGRQPEDVRKIAGVFEWALGEFSSEEARAVLATTASEKPLPDAEGVLRTVAAAEESGFLRRRSDLAKDPEALRPEEMPDAGLPVVVTLPPEQAAFVRMLATRFAAVMVNRKPVSEGDVLTLALDAAAGILYQRQRDLGRPLTAHDALEALKLFAALQTQALPVGMGASDAG
jgi:hypothetical protein